jgi:hypothetical protein
MASGSVEHHRNLPVSLGPRARFVRILAVSVSS